MRGRSLNFDPESLDGPGWEHDDYRQPLGSEQPGPPEPGGSWETAVALSRRYAFADPSLVEARYDPAVPLEQRDMLLILHALGARIYAGVRVSDVGNEARSEGGREARVFFWNYRTLEGHVEAGQRDFEVWKWLDTGQVEFGRRACRRMALLTEVSSGRPRAAETADILDGRLLALYLRDHHALLVAMGELAGRMSAAGRPGEQRAFAGELGRAATADRAAVEELLSRLDSAPSRVRHAGAWTFEKLGRLKLNGRVLRPSPLSSVTELEGCGFLLESTRALWSGLAHLAIGPTDAADRARRTDRLVEVAERLRLDALHRATHQRVDTAADPR